LRELISANIDGIEFIRAFRRSESDRFCLTAEKIAAIDSALNNSSESNLQVKFRCSKILRQDILQARSWQFDGTLNSDTSEMLPTKLFSLLQWILSGVATEILTEKRPIEDSGFDDAWVEAGICGSTTKHQILEGNHMKRALTAHFMTYFTLCDLHVDMFLRAEKDESGAEFPNLYVAALKMNDPVRKANTASSGRNTKSS